MNIDIVDAKFFDEFSSSHLYHGANPPCGGPATGQGHLAFPLGVEKVV